MYTKFDLHTLWRIESSVLHALCLQAAYELPTICLQSALSTICVPCVSAVRHLVLH